MRVVRMMGILRQNLVGVCLLESSLVTRCALSVSIDEQVQEMQLISVKLEIHLNIAITRIQVSNEVLKLGRSMIPDQEDIVLIPQPR